MPVDKKDPALEDDTLDPLEAARESGAAAIRITPLTELLEKGGKEPTLVAGDENLLDLPAGERGVVHAQVHEVLFEPVPPSIDFESPEEQALKTLKGMGLFDGVREEDLKALAAEASYETMEAGQKIADMYATEHALYIPNDTTLASIGNRDVRLEGNKPYGIYVFVGVEKPTVDITVREKGAVFTKIPAAAFERLSPEAQDRVMRSVLGNSHLSMLNRELSRDDRVLAFPEHAPTAEELALIKSEKVFIGEEDFAPGMNIPHRGDGVIAFIAKGGVDVQTPLGVGAHKKVAEIGKGNFVGERQAAGFNKSATMRASSREGASMIWCRLTREMLKVAVTHQAAKVRMANDALLSQ